MSNRIALTACFCQCVLWAACGAPAKNEPTADGPAVSEDALSYEASEPPPQPTVPRQNQPESFSKRMSVKLLRTSAAVETPSNQALNPNKDFRTGTKRIYASFDVKGFNPGATIRVHWYKDEDLIDENDLECEGDRRYAAKIEAPKGLVSGEYSVEVEVEGEVYAKRSFFVGNAFGGPAVEKAALGTKLGKNNMPSAEKTTFKSNVKVIKCGVSFLDLPQNAKITVRWIGLADSGEELRHTTDTIIDEGGTGSTGAAWNPGGTLAPGPYKVEILVDDTKMVELPFTVK